LPELIDDKYEVLAKIKEGGMGAIFKVRHVYLEEIRVIKMIRRDIVDDPDAQKRFVREARMATQLKHPNIAALIDFVARPDQSFYMVMEYIDGYHLGEYVERFGKPALATSIEIALQTLDALAYLHQKGIVHRNISPENLMLTRDADGRLLVKMIDLGVAKETAAEGMTITGMFVGKLKYCSPEQLGALRKGEKIDGRSDLYSLGCVLFQLLTGEPAYFADTPQGYIRQHLLQPPRRFEAFDPNGSVPEPLREVVYKSLSKKRDQRFASAEEFATALREARDALKRKGGSSAWNSAVDDATKPFPRQVPAPPPEATLEAGPTIEVEAPPPPPRRSSASGWPAAPRVASDEAELLAAGSRTLREVKSAPAKETASPLATAQAPPRRALGLLAAALAVLVVAGVTALVLSRNRTAPAAQTGALQLVASPWARVVSVEDQRTNVAQPVGNLVTPARLTLPPGRYTIRLKGPGRRGEAETFVTAEVTAGQETRKDVTIPGFDLDEAVRSHAFSK
jgi:serine/threonine-protein kinase